MENHDLTDKHLRLLISWTLYPISDLIGQLIANQFNFSRVLVLALVGGLVYQREIPSWFRQLSDLQINPNLLGFRFLHHFIEKDKFLARLNGLGRTVGSICYFNPLWIARHMVFISLATTSWKELVPGAVLFSAIGAGTATFLVNLPLALFGNYLIQDKLPLRLRYFGSIILSATMSIIYAIVHVSSR